MIVMILATKIVNIDVKEFHSIREFDYSYFLSSSSLKT
jgi:hypothetical protein